MTFFDEFFNDSFFKNFEEVIKGFENEQEENGTNYYKKVIDEYEDGKRVSHNEKEVRNGKVIKDIHENYKIEDKSEHKTKKCECNENAQKLSEKDEEIKRLKEKIDSLEKENERKSNKNEEYLNRISALESKFSELKKIFA